MIYRAAALDQVLWANNLNHLPQKSGKNQYILLDNGKTSYLESDGDLESVLKQLRENAKEPEEKNETFPAKNTKILFEKKADHEEYLRIKAKIQDANPNASQELIEEMAFVIFQKTDADTLKDSHYQQIIDSILKAQQEHNVTLIVEQLMLLASGYHHLAQKHNDEKRFEKGT